MNTKITFMRVMVIVMCMAAISCEKKIHLSPPVCGEGNATITTSKVVYTGLNSPRGIKFGPDGSLYVAEAGVGGKDSTNKCMQVPPPVGPYKGSDTGSRISRIDWQGVRTTVADMLPSSNTVPPGNQGVADVQFIGNDLYAVLAGAGCSHAVPDIPNGIIRVGANKTWKMVANCSNFLMDNPVASPDPADFEPDGTPYSMTSVDGDLYITQPNQQEIDRIDPKTGKIARVIDLSKQFPGPTDWHGPTSMVYHHGSLYFGILTPFPIVQGAANVYKLSLDGKLSVFATGFTTILGVAFDDNNRLYVLENTVGAPFPTPGLGDVVRLDPSGSRQVLTSGLNLPTAMTFGPDGRLYISNWGIGAPGAGQIVQLSFKCEIVHSDH